MSNVKIVSINEKANPDITKLNDTKWQISGNAAKEILAVMDAAKSAAIAAEKAANAAHEKVWEAIYKKTNTSSKESFSVDTTHKDAGILFLIKKEKKSGLSGLEGLLEAIRDSME